MSLSAAIVVEDEAERLDACLTSLEGLVDEIVVVDTGSTDRTVAVAEAHGALVAHAPGHGDLAALRNRSLDLATGDWILHVHADEQIRGDFDDARTRLEHADFCVAFGVRYVPRAGWTPLRELRLWRNRSDIRFRHMDDSVVATIGAVDESDHLAICPFDPITIQRGSCEGDRADERARDESMLRADLERKPDHPFAYDHLAHVYEAAGDAGRAVGTWKRGIEQVRRRDHTRPEDRLLYIDLLHHLLATGAVDDELEVLVDEARERFERTPTLELAAARLAFASGRPRDALEPLEWLLSLDDEAIIATGASYDERVFGEWAWGLLGLCRFALGDDAAAAEAFGRAEELAPEDAAYGVRRRLAEARAANPPRSPTTAGGA